MAECIMVVEDDPGLARLLAKCLQRSGYAVVVCETGESALQHVGDVAVGAVVMDYNLPGMTGLDLLQRLVAGGSPPPTVMLTGAGNEQVAVEAMKLGAGDYIIKDTAGTYLERVPHVLAHLLENAELKRRQQQAEAALRASEERFRAIANHTYAWESWVAPDGMLKWVNPAVERITGFTIQQCFEMKDYPLPIIHEPDRGRIREVLATALAGSAGADVEFRARIRSGAIRWMEMSWQPIFGERGERLGYRSSVRDIERRKLAEGALENLRNQMKQEPETLCGIVGRTPLMTELFETIREVAQSDVPVFIHGESGTGKELVALAIHNLSRRAGRPFVPVNCSALPATLMESELFGHVKGAFTGAMRQRRGRFELSDSGTIMLDEVGDLSPAVQVALLRVLEEGTIERVGDEKRVNLDVRVVSATHRDLKAEVAAGRFRADLFYRLCVFPIRVPSLRERREDIPLLAAHFLRQISRRSPGSEHLLLPEAMGALARYDWPGNVRELLNALEFAAVKCLGQPIAPHHLPDALRHTAPTPTPDAIPPSPAARRSHLTPEAIAEALRATRGNRLEAARVLGVSRATFYRHLENLEVNPAE